MLPFLYGSKLFLAFIKSLISRSLKRLLVKHTRLILVQGRIEFWISLVVVETSGLPSQPRFELALIKMYGNVKIKYNGEIVGESDSLIVIDASCRLSLQTTSGRHIITLKLYRQDDRRLYNRGPYFLVHSFIIMMRKILCI